MGVGGYSSLTGKARRILRLAGCAAWETQRRVEELEAEDPRVVSEDRVIPVRHRAEFIPTASPEREPSPDDSAVGPTFEQLKLSFAREEEPAASADSDLEYATWAEAVAQAGAEESAPVASAFLTQEAIKIAGKRQQVAPAPKPATSQSAPPIVVRPKVAQPSMLPGQLPDQPWQPPAGSGRPFTIRGVLLGCALGGIAAAAAILLLSALL